MAIFCIKFYVLFTPKETTMGCPVTRLTGEANAC